MFLCWTRTPLWQVFGNWEPSKTAWFHPSDVLIHTCTTGEVLVVTVQLICMMDGPCSTLSMSERVFGCTAPNTPKTQRSFDVFKKPTMAKMTTKWEKPRPGVTAQPGHAVQHEHKEAGLDSGPPWSFRSTLCWSGPTPSTTKEKLGNIVKISDLDDF